MNKCIFDYARKAKSCSYGSLRSKDDVAGIVIHYTGNAGDTAKNNADYFATGNTRSAGAHIFISADGSTAYSIPITRVAWSVGNPNNCYARGSYYATLKNANTVSIELCDLVGHGITAEQKESLIRACKWLKKKCKNIRYVVRHYDIVNKCCPSYYVDNPKEWLLLQSEIMDAIGLYL